MSIRTKLLIILSLVAILAAGMIGFIAYWTGKTTLEEESFKKLTAVREMKADQVESYFRIIRDQATTLSEDRMIIDAVKSFKSAFQKVDDELEISYSEMNEIDSNLRVYYENEYLPRLNPNLGNEGRLEDYWPQDIVTRILQDQYISSNPNNTGSKHLLNSVEDGSTYSKIHSIYHPIIRSYLEKFGYYDIFLVDPETGHIVYSVFKEVDFGTSLLAGPYRNTNFAAVFREVLKEGTKDYVKLVDFEGYYPSYNDQASFIASPIYDDKILTGVLVFQMPIDRINDIMTSNQKWSDVGLGDSGETYIVGSDHTLRNQSRFLIEDKDNYFRMIEDIGTAKETIEKIKNFNNSIGLQEVRTEGTIAALNGESDEKIFNDYRSILVLSSYKPLNITDVNWAIMSEIDQDEAFAEITTLGFILLFSFLGLIILIIIFAFFFSKSIVNPLQKLTRSTDELSKHDFTKTDQFHFSEDIVGISNQTGEVGTLATAFQKMELELNKSISNLKTTMKANERMESELNIGREIQMSMLPLLFPALPKQLEISVYATLQAAYEVGGDFFDYYLIDDDWFFFCVGDVSDKGVPAALFMAVTKTLIKSRATDDRLPSNVMTRINEELCQDNPSSMFVTVLAAALNIRTGELHYTSAGHNPPYIKRLNGSLERLDKHHGPALGVMGGIKYKEDILHLSKGDVIFLYTDGVTEAKNSSNELFTEKRLVSLLQDHEFNSVEQYVESTINVVEEFQGVHQSDDITVLALQYLGEPSGEETIIMDLTIKNHLEEIDLVDRKISLLADEYELDGSTVRKIRLACDDLLNNVISYAYDDKSDHYINIQMTKTKDRIKIIITDDGKPFDPFSQPSPDISSSLENRKIGGLGIHLVRNLMNKVAYHRNEEKAAKNVITMIMHLE